jgi:transcriptional regulator with XRE-family HTH domain
MVGELSKIPTTKQLLEIFKKEGISQREFARETEISYSHLNHILNNQVVCSFETLQKACKKLNYKINVEIIQA